jgi:sensor c-di-GMP phosphodiesterase-like protein
LSPADGEKIFGLEALVRRPAIRRAGLINPTEFVAIARRAPA